MIQYHWTIMKKYKFQMCNIKRMRIMGKRCLKC